MPRKVFQVQVAINIEAVTCPGVWLCSKGEVSLQIYMLDSCIQTRSLQPVFPLLYHEQFIFYKTFYLAQRLSDLQSQLGKEFIYAELIQWKNFDLGHVLANFHCSLVELLYPTACDGSIAGVDLDLLMEPAKNFPGILAPKLEVNTKTTIEEVVCKNMHKKCSSFVVNPKLVKSNSLARKHNKLRQQKVCHSVGYHRSRNAAKPKSTKKPPFIHRKFDEDLIYRKPQGLEEGPNVVCTCAQNFVKRSNNNKIEIISQSVRDKVHKLKTDRNFVDACPSSAQKLCLCGSGHMQENCPICTKYEYYFEKNPSCTCFTPRTPQVCRRCSPRKNTDDMQKKCCPTLERKSCKQCPANSERSNKYCSSPQRDSLEARECNCDVERKRDTNNICFCPLHRKSSLAEQLHQRLMKTLNSGCCSTCVDLEQCRSGGKDDDDNQELVLQCDSCLPPVECVCPKLNYRNCRNEFYNSLDKFYKRLHTGSRNRDRREYDATNCCT